MPEPRWLTAEEQRAWRAYLQATQRLFAAVEAQLQRDAGLSHGDYEILVRLSEAPQRRLRMAQLATGLLFSRSRLSHAAGRLERAGWLRREAHPGDGRGTVAVLTDAGHDLLVATAPGHVAAVRRELFDRLTAEQVDQLHRLSAAVALDVAPDQDDATRTEETSGRSADERPTSST